MTTRKLTKHRMVKMTPKILNQMYNDYYLEKMTFKQLAIKYNRHEDTISKHIKLMNRPPDPEAPFDPGIVETRKKLDPIARLDEFKRDSTAAAELIVALIHYQAAQDMEIIKKNDPKLKPRLSIKDLTWFFAEVAPYVLSKVDAKKAGSEEKETSSEKVYDMFKKEQESKKAQA